MPETQKFRHFHITVGIFLLFSLNAYSLKFPTYSQQCADDAGIPYPDDEEYFGNGKYHDGSAATPVLLDNGECSPPVKAACESTGKTKQAYIEGPIDCGGNGWYCRILEDPTWPQMNLKRDLNFAYCNTTMAFEDDTDDTSGHCHGSSDDSTYYWWVRDHWFRQYNGRLRCCCGWYDGDEPVTAGRIVNGCDYRRLVVDENDASSCRDANEDHGLGFRSGCDSSMQSSIGKPLVEDDGQCWELHKFGDGRKDDDGIEGSGDESGDGEGSGSGDNGEEGSGDGSGEGGGSSSGSGSGSGSGDGEGEGEDVFGCGGGEGEEEGEDGEDGEVECKDDDEECLKSKRSRGILTRFIVKMSNYNY